MSADTVAAKAALLEGIRVAVVALGREWTTENDGAKILVDGVATVLRVDGKWQGHFLPEKTIVSFGGQLNERKRTYSQLKGGGFNVKGIAAALVEWVDGRKVRLAAERTANDRREESLRIKGLLTNEVTKAAGIRIEGTELPDRVRMSWYRELTQPQAERMIAAIVAAMKDVQV